MTERFRGSVKWFDEDKAFGFLIPDSVTGRAADVFVHLGEVEKSKIRPGDLYQGRRIEFSQKIPERGNRKKLVACELKLLD